MAILKSRRTPGRRTRCPSTSPRPEDFEHWYAANSDVTVEELHAFGRYAFTCSCGDPACTGWQMRNADELTETDALLEGWAIPMRSTR